MVSGLPHSDASALRARYESVLKEAQKLGYAEADPAADVPGARAGQSVAGRFCFGIFISKYIEWCS